MLKILIIDDDPSGTQLLSTLLEFEGYHTQPLENWDAPVGDVERYRPDLIIMDVMMPGLSGHETCQRIRNDPDLAKTHIIMLTAKGQEIDRLHSIEAGANEYITKPFDPDQLVKRAADVLGVRV